MVIDFTPQFSYQNTVYDNDLENEIIRVQITTMDGDELETIEHDLSNYVPPESEEMAEDPPPSFPIAGYPKRIDGVLHVTLIKWYR
ncbi:hypothetical protein QGM71_02715 [Virgibacillus sp. C22-A2]|uniref:Uncharacterized protein n=1 Tax=Virgibacillus tibetensis TaxID=3042313 RepID=A0ABU6KD10_9BACI|nr:hypothetical protein [Virgibacillus sp. C22-A2]